MLKIARFSVTDVVMITVSFILMGVILPIGIGLLSAAGDQAVMINGTSTLVSTVADANVLTLLTVLVPILGIVSIALAYIPKMR